MTYPTVGNLKTYLDISVTTDDTLLGWLLDAAIETIEKSTGRETFVASGAVVRRFPVSARFVSADRRVLSLRGMEVTSVTSITNGDQQNVPSAEWILQPYGGTNYWQIVLIPDSTYRWSGGYMIEVNAVWGYSTSCPADVFTAILDLAKYSYLARSSGSAGTPIQTGRGLLLAPSGWPESVEEVVKRYRRGGV